MYLSPPQPLSPEKPDIFFLGRMLKVNVPNNQYYRRLSPSICYILSDCIQKELCRVTATVMLALWKSWACGAAKESLICQHPTSTANTCCMILIGLKLSTTKFKRHRALPWENDPPRPSETQSPTIGVGASGKILIAHGQVGWVSLPSLVRKQEPKAYQVTRRVILKKHCTRLDGGGELGNVGPILT